MPHAVPDFLALAHVAHSSEVTEAAAYLAAMHLALMLNACGRVVIRRKIMERCLVGCVELSQIDGHLLACKSEHLSTSRHPARLGGDPEEVVG